MSETGLVRNPRAGVSRRTLLCGGCAAGAVGLLAACGRQDRRSAEPAADGTVRVPAADTPAGSSTYYRGAKIVVSQPVEGEFIAFDAVCPHQGCQTSERGADGQLVCPCHDSTFDPATGEALSGPATRGLTVLPVSVEGADLVIRG